MIAIMSGSFTMITLENVSSWVKIIFPHLLYILAESPKTYHILTFFKICGWRVTFVFLLQVLHLPEIVSYKKMYGLPALFKLNKFILSWWFIHKARFLIWSIISQWDIEKAFDQLNLRTNLDQSFIPKNKLFA